MATVQCIQQANGPRDSGWTDLLAQAPTTSPTLAQAVLAVPPDADSRELRYDGASGRATGSSKRSARQPSVEAPSDHPSQASSTDSGQLPPVSGHPNSGTADSNGLGGMVTRGSKKKTAAVALPSEMPEAASRPSAGGPVSGEIGPSTSPIGRRGADIIAEVVGDLAMDDAGNLTERVVPAPGPTRPAGEAGAVMTEAVARPAVSRIHRERVRQLTPIVRDATARPAERSIMYLSANEIRSQITRYPQAGETVETELARQGWYPGRPVGGSLTLLAALIG